MFTRFTRQNIILVSELQTTSLTLESKTEWVKSTQVQEIALNKFTDKNNF